MHSLAVALLLTSSAFAAGTTGEEERRRANWPSSWWCSNNYDCKQIGQYCYTSWLGFNYCSAGQAVGSLCSTSHDCGYIGNRALNCINGKCYDYSPSPSPSPSPSGCTSSEDCPKIGEFCYGEYSLTNGVCKKGDGLGSMCRQDSSCGYIGNRPVSCISNICIDTGSSPDFGRRLDNALPSVEPSQPEDEKERRRPGLQYPGPSGTNCQNNYDCKKIGQYCYSGRPLSYCAYGQAVGSLCSTSHDCGHQGNRALTCKWGTCALPSPSPSPSGGCRSSEDCPGIGEYCYGEYSLTNGVCKKGDGLGSMCRKDSSCGSIGNRPVSCIQNICNDVGSSPGRVFGRRLDNAQPADNAQPNAQTADNAQPIAQPNAQPIMRFPPPKGFGCKSASDCYQGQECVKAKPFNYCNYIWGRRADEIQPTRRAEGSIVRFPPPPKCNCKTSADCLPWTTGEFCFKGNPFNCCQKKNPIGAICSPWKTGECGYGYCSSGGVCKASGRRLQESEDSS